MPGIDLEWPLDPPLAQFVGELAVLLAQAPELIRQGFLDRLPGLLDGGLQLELVPAARAGEFVVVSRLPEVLRDELRAAAAGAAGLGCECVHGHPSRKMV
jgi:hypothetical protein